MKSFFQKRENKIIIWIVLSFLLVLIIPLVINCLFEIPAFHPVFAVNWEVTDALAFYGSILGAGATIYVLHETIKFTVSNQKEERRLSIRPYLTTSKRHYNDKISEVLHEKDFLYVEIQKNLPFGYDGLPDNIYTMLKSYVSVNNDNKPKKLSTKRKNSAPIDAFLNDNYLLCYEIINCGAGNAIDVRLDVDEVTLQPFFCITTDTPKKILFNFRSDLLDEKQKTIKIKITYSDVASLGKYTQEESFEFSRNSLGKLQIVQMTKNLLTSPVESQQRDSK